MNKIKSIITALALLFVVGCGSLAKDGAYKNQKVVYVADQSFSATFTIIDAFLKWEHENREHLFALAPDIKGAADNIRRDVPGWVTQYQAAHDAYLLAPTRDNQNAIDEALDQLMRLASAAQTITIQYN